MAGGDVVDSLQPTVDSKEMQLDKKIESSPTSSYSILSGPVEDSKLIAMFAQKGVTAAQVSEYSLPVALRTRGWHDLQGVPAEPFAADAICYGADNALNLKHGNRTVAIIAYDIDAEDNALVVKQIQGVVGAKAELELFKTWEALLINALIQYGRAHKKQELRIQSSGTNPSFNLPIVPLKENSQEQHAAREVQKGLIRERLTTIYDIIPKRMGFEWDETDKCWIYNLHINDEKI